MRDSLILILFTGIMVMIEGVFLRENILLGGSNDKGI